MKQIPVNEEKIPAQNKKAIGIILLLIICGIITGLILSSFFVIEANERIKNFEEETKPQKPLDFTFEAEPLTFSDIIIPSLGVIIVCISTYLLAGLIIVYINEGESIHATETWIDTCYYNRDVGDVSAN